jgi:hypothetical protein
VLVESEMNRALEEASGDYLGDRVAAIMAKLERTQARAANEPDTARVSKKKK